MNRILATAGFQPAGPYLTATPNTRYSFHVCIADRSPSDLFGRKQRLTTLIPPDEGLVDLVTRHVSEGRDASTRSRFGFPKLPYFGETY